MMALLEFEFLFETTLPPHDGLMRLPDPRFANPGDKRVGD